MQRHLLITNTDQVNRDNMKISASTLMKAEEEHHSQCFHNGLEVGIPSNIQHDMHRPIGWAHPLGLYIDRSMVRSIGMLELPENEKEKNDLRKRIQTYWQFHHREKTKPFRDELIARVHPAGSDKCDFTNIEAAVLIRPNIAAELYSDLFSSNSNFVDKDGLIDYHELLRQMDQLQPGIFHDPKRNVLLFAHRFFRRSLSHRNKLNAYFLRLFDKIAKQNDNLRVRIKLDPDLIGHPDSLRELIELEYWRGPKYNDDISCIPSGVAEHKASERNRYYEGIDRTQVWWKASEERCEDNQPVSYRTFEAEELIENPSGGLNEDQFGCRYVHAEFSGDELAITHFDGAIRAYNGDSYLDRIDLPINRAGKHADYTKVFRVDGSLSIPLWKQLLTDYFKGNSLISEYLGAPTEDIETAETTTIASEPTIAALISIQPNSSNKTMQLCPELYLEYSGLNIPYVETGLGEVNTFLQNRCNLTDIAAIGFKDDILNLSRLNLGTPDEQSNIFDREVSALSQALSKDVSNGLTKYTAIPLSWNIHDRSITLTLAGEALKVADLLSQLPGTIIPTKTPSEWIESFVKLVHAVTPLENPAIMNSGIEHGILTITRQENVEFQIQIPKKIAKQLPTENKPEAT